LARDTTNGAESIYIFSWFTDIQTDKGDQLNIVLPDEVKIPFAIKEGLPGYGFKCEGKTGLAKNGVDCKYKKVKKVDDHFAVCSDTNKCVDGDDTKDAVIISMNEILYESGTGLFKVQVDSLINPPSLRGSGPFYAIYQTTSAERENAKIAEYDQTTDPVVVTTDYAALFKGLGPDSIQ